MYEETKGDETKTKRSSKVHSSGPPKRFTKKFQGSKTYWTSRSLMRERERDDITRCWVHGRWCTTVYTILITVV